MTDWLSYRSIVILFGLSIAGFVGTLVVIPWILVRLPPHYFDERHPRIWLAKRHPVLRAVLLGIKNVVGFIFLLAGIPMVVPPGQRIPAMPLGLAGLGFPRKRLPERLLVSPTPLPHCMHRLGARLQ